MRGIQRRVAVLAAALFNVGINALAGAGVLFGTTTGAVSDSVETGVTPAGWAFAAIYAANVPSPGEAPALTAALGLGVLAFVLAVVWALRHGRSPLPVTA